MYVYIYVYMYTTSTLIYMDIYMHLFFVLGVLRQEDWAQKLQEMTASVQKNAKEDRQIL